MIGGTVTGAGNVIVNNAAVGIEINGALATTVEGNDIGTDASGGTNLGNLVGVEMDGATSSVIGGTVTGAGNTIAFNTTGVEINGGSGNAIRENLIYSNTTSFGSTSLPSLPVAPSILAVASVPSLTTIDYSVTGTPGQAYSIDFFASNAGESPAALFLGTVTTPALTSATQSFTATLNPGTSLVGSQVTATATDPSNNTSFFATAVATSSPFVVTKTSDNVPGSAVGSLRQAILDANQSPGSTITFDIPGTGPFVINTATALPSIVVPTTIDGRTEPGYTGTPIVELDGGGGNFNGLTLGAGSNSSTIEGLSIVGYGIAAIELDAGADVVAANFIGVDPSGTAGPGNFWRRAALSGGNTIGGTTAGSANVIGFSNSSNGVGVVLASNGNLVEGNFIGTDAAGDNLGNTYGIYIQPGAGNTIGGTTAAAANVIGFSSAQAVVVFSATATLVEGNDIGTNASGAHLGNALGVAIGNSSTGTTIGGTAAGAANTIAFNTGAAVDVVLRVRQRDP